MARAASPATVRGNRLAQTAKPTDAMRILQKEPRTIPYSLRDPQSLFIRVTYLQMKPCIKLRFGFIPLDLLFFIHQSRAPAGELLPATTFGREDTAAVEWHGEGAPSAEGAARQRG